MFTSISQEPLGVPDPVPMRMPGRSTAEEHTQSPAECTSFPANRLAMWLCFLVTYVCVCVKYPCPPLWRREPTTILTSERPVHTAEHLGRPLKLERQ